MAPTARVPLWLPAPGDVIWELLAAPRSVDELVDELTAAFDAGTDAIAEDVVRFVADLQQAGLLGR